MTRTEKILITIIGILLIGCLILFLRRPSPQEDYDKTSWKKDIKSLQDSIKVLNSQIVNLQEDLFVEELRRDSIHVLLIENQKNYEKTDSTLRTLSTDEHIRFLSDFLSKEDAYWAGHSDTIISSTTSASE